jgi:histidyl-tRNA synthetase
VGFALGQERLAMVLDAVGRKPPDPRLTVFFISADEAGALEGLKRAAELRRAGIACDLDPRGGKLQFKQAERVGARYALVLGGNEVQTGQAQLRDLATREETPVALAELAARVPR